MHSIRPIVIALVLAVMSVSLDAQTVLDAKTVKAIKQTEEELVGVRKAADAANRRLQDDYARMQELFELMRSGRDVEARRDLERILEEPLKEAVEAGFAGSRGKRAMKRNLSREISKAEHELLVAFSKELALAVTSAHDLLADAGRKTVEVGELADAAIAQLLPPDVPFWKHWNETLRLKAPSHEDYVAAMKELERVEGALMVLKDPKMRFAVGAPKGMARVEGGAITIESTYGFQADRRKTRTEAFYIDLREVTHGEYWGKFWVNLEDKVLKQTYMPMIRDGEREYQAWVQDMETGEYAPIPEMMDLPVTGIDAVAALAYARSQGKRLPTEAEWIAAATATPGKCSEYPWGDDYREGLANDAKAGLKKTRPVGLSPDGRSHFGLYDVAGNVKEWTFTLVEGKDLDDQIPDGAILAIRGGSFESSASGISLKWRWQLPARNTRENDVGFRCARDAK